MSSNLPQDRNIKKEIKKEIKTNQGSNTWTFMDSTRKMNIGPYVLDRETRMNREQKMEDWEKISESVRLKEKGKNRGMELPTQGKSQTGWFDGAMGGKETGKWKNEWKLARSGSDLVSGVVSDDLLYRPSSISAVDHFLEKSQPQLVASLFHIAKLIANASNTTNLLETLKRESSRLVHASLCRVILVTAAGLFPTDSTNGYVLGTGLVGECQQTGSILHVESPSTDSRFAVQLDSFGTPAHLLCVPIQAQSVGLVAILTLEAEKPFSNEASSALYSLGEFVAGTLKASTSLDQTNKLYAVSNRVNGRVEIMLEIAKALMSEHRLSVLVSFIISEVPELLDCDRCTLFFVDRRTNELIVTKNASHGRRANSMNQEVEKKVDGQSTEGGISSGSLPFGKGAGEIRFPMGKGIAGHVAMTGQTVNIQDAYADDRFSPQMDYQSGYKTRNILCVPMVDSHNDIIGLIQVLNKNENEIGFDESDEVLLKMFAACAAIAVKNSRLFAEAQKALKKSDALLEVTHAISQELVFAPLINIIVTKIQQLLTAERCTVFLIDEDTQTMYSTASMSHGMGSSLPIDNNLEAVVRFPLDKGIVGLVAKSGEVLNLADAYQDVRFNRAFDKETGFRTKALLTVPIINSKKKTIGVTQVLNKKNGGSFNEEDIKLLLAFTEQIAIAFGNSRLYHETKKSLNAALREQRNLKFMLEFTRNLCAEMQTSSVVSSLQFQVKEILKADFVQVFLMDKESGGYHRFEEEAKVSHARFDINLGIAGKVLRTSEPVLISHSVASTPEFSLAVDAYDERVPNSILIVPIIYDPARDPSKREDDVKASALAVLGCISVIYDTSRQVFSGDDQRLLSSLCYQASVFILLFACIMQMSLVKSEQLAKLVETANKENAAHNDDKLGEMFNNADDFDSFQYKMTDFKIIETIGSGSYGEVYAAKLHGKIVAVKKLNSRGLKSEHIDSFCSEASLMCQLKHPNVVQFIGAVTQPPDLCIITEYCAKGSLCDLLLNHDIKIEFSKKLQIMIDSAAGMCYLHDSNPVILHRDLKSDNLLVTYDWSIKVADFGLSRFRSEQKQMTQVGTPMWMAPEVIKGEKYTEKADVYSFGIIIWEIMTRLEPYDDKEAMQIVVEVVNHQLRPNIPPQYEDCPLLPLMKDCWNQDPLKRPTFKITRDRLIKIAEQFAGTKKWT